MWLQVRNWQLQSQMQVRATRLKYFTNQHILSIGGIGVIGGIRQSPKMLQESISDLKSYLEDKDAPFGVDLLIPQIGGSARKTNVS